MILHTAVLESALRVCEGTSTPRALTVAILLRYEEWDQLVSLRVDPMRYYDPQSYFKDAMVTDLFRKYPGFPLSVDLHAEAVKAFYESEKQCFSSNIRLNPYLEGFSHPSCDMRVHAVLARARKKVAEVLGRAPKIVRGRFGPGATFDDKGRKNTVPHKMSASPTMTPGSWPHLFDWASTAWASACANRGEILTSVRGNRFTSVPKDSTKNRGICIEPSLNIYYQLGIGDKLKERLSRAGLSTKPDGGQRLPDGLSEVLSVNPETDRQHIHRALARDGSATGRWATIDLSSASDTVCYNLVKLLLPPDWFELLESVRSPYTLIEGKWVRLEKFSSMGNGYTFELETLIFASLISAVTPQGDESLIWGHEMFVYGDDIVIPPEFVDEVLAILRFCGFTPNASKTFSEGPFRESCGGDYFMGQNVRTYYLKHEVTKPHHLIQYANGLSRLLERHLCDDTLRAALRRAWFCVLDALPSDIRRCRGPASLGDVVIHDAPEYWSLRVIADTQSRELRAYLPARFRRVPWEQFHGDVQLACALLGIGSTLDGFTPRGDALSYKCGWISVPF